MSAAEIMAYLREQQIEAFKDCHNKELMKWFRQRQAHHSDRLNQIITHIEQSQ
jgi:hypothetical protein